MKQSIEIREFARRVERLCDFLLDRISENGVRDGSGDIRVIEHLREEAADIQFRRVQPVSETIEGLDVYMRNLNAAFEQPPEEPVKE